MLSKHCCPNKLVRSLQATSSHQNGLVHYKTVCLPCSLCFERDSSRTFPPQWRGSSLSVPDWAGADGGLGQYEPGRVRNVSVSATLGHLQGGQILEPREPCFLPFGSRLSTPHTLNSSSPPTPTVKPATTPASSRVGPFFFRLSPAVEGQVAGARGSLPLGSGLPPEVGRESQLGRWEEVVVMQKEEETQALRSTLLASGWSNSAARGLRERETWSRPRTRCCCHPLHFKAKEPGKTFTGERPKTLRAPGGRARSADIRSWGEGRGESSQNRNWPKMPTILSVRSFLGAVHATEASVWMSPGRTKPHSPPSPNCC